MKAYEFIFSNRSSYRLSRHIIFWIIFLFYFYSVSFLPAKPSDLNNPKSYLDGFELMIYIPESVISVYISAYFLLPRYILKENYIGLLLLSPILLLFYLSLAWSLTLLLALASTHVTFTQLPVSFRWFQPIRYGIGLPLTSAVFVIVIKLLKHWHLEQKENEVLQRVKIQTEFQLLKTQFQPVFLYDALQHIFFLIHKNSTQSPETVLKLSDVLSYILYENEKDVVPLDKEIEITKTYLGLKKTFYPERLWVTLNQQGDTSGMKISPLLLISLVENCLEKFLVHSHRPLALFLDIKAENNEVSFLLECKNELETESMVTAGNHQWIKTLKRIEMLYPGRHSFDVFSENGSTSLLLVIEAGGIGNSINKEITEFVLS